MATKTSKYEFNKPEQNDFYDVDVQNENWDKLDKELSEFDDSGATEDIKSFPDFLTKFVTGNKVAVTLRNLKAGLQFVLHAGQIVNNCVTDNAELPLSAAQGKVLKDLYTQLYSDSNRRFLIDKVIYNSLTDLPSKGSCFGVIGNAPILINDSFSIPAYSRFAFINTGDSTDGALLAIDANGNIYSAYRNNGIWNAGQVSASKSDLSNFQFISANNFDDAWNKAAKNTMCFADITGNTGAPTQTANRWFAQIFKNDTEKYGWITTWSFTGGVYKKERNNSSS